LKSSAASVPPITRWVLRARARQCDGKVRFGRQTAQVVAAEMTERFGKPIDAYYCTFCGWHHTGNRPWWKKGPGAMGGNER
jgi:hypothetical protein